MISTHAKYMRQSAWTTGGTHNIRYQKQTTHLIENSKRFQLFPLYFSFSSLLPNLSSFLSLQRFSISSSGGSTALSTDLGAVADTTTITTVSTSPPLPLLHPFPTTMSQTTFLNKKDNHNCKALINGTNASAHCRLFCCSSIEKKKNVGRTQFIEFQLFQKPQPPKTPQTPNAITHQKHKPFNGKNKRSNCYKDENSILDETDPRWQNWLKRNQVC